MYKGIFEYTNSLERIRSFKMSNPNGKVLIISDDKNNLPIDILNNAVYGSVLIPPYSILALEVNGDPRFDAEYYQYLCSPNTTELITLMIYCLYKGTNVLVYIPIDEAELRFTSILFQYIFSRYGISPNYEGNPGSINPSIFPSVLDAFLLFRLINYTEYFNLYDINAHIVDPAVLGILTQIFPTCGSYCNIYDVNSVSEYFTNLKNCYKKNLNLNNGLIFKED